MVRPAQAWIAAPRGRSALGRAAGSRAGLSLIELIVVMALVAALMFVLLPAVAAGFGATRRAATSDLAATLRFVRDEAVVRNVPMRLAFDLDANTWWVEAADGPVRIFRDRGEREAFSEFLEQKKESDARVREMVDANRSSIPTMSDVLSNMLGVDPATDDNAAAMMGGFLGGLFGGGNALNVERGGEYKVNEFHPLGDEDEAFEKRTLPDGVRISGVWTPQYEDIARPSDTGTQGGSADTPRDSGTRAYVHVFPSGTMEEAVVYVSDDEGGGTRSIVIEPLTGRVAVVPDEIDPRDRYKEWR